MTTEKLATGDELADFELATASAMERDVSSFRAFPTVHNLDRVLSSMRVYQTAWMNGRTRLRLTRCE